MHTCVVWKAWKARAKNYKFYGAHRISPFFFEKYLSLIPVIFWTHRNIQMKIILGGIISKSYRWAEAFIFPSFRMTRPLCKNQLGSLPPDAYKTSQQAVASMGWGQKYMQQFLLNSLAIIRTTQQVPKTWCCCYSPSVAAFHVNLKTDDNKLSGKMEMSGGQFLSIKQ